MLVRVCIGVRKAKEGWHNKDNDHARAVYSEITFSVETPKEHFLIVTHCVNSDKLFTWLRKKCAKYKRLETSTKNRICFLSLMYPWLCKGIRPQVSGIQVCGLANSKVIIYIWLTGAGLKCISLLAIDRSQDASSYKWNFISSLTEGGDISSHVLDTFYLLFQLINSIQNC